MTSITIMSEIQRKLTDDDLAISRRIKNLYALKKRELKLTQEKIAEFTGWTQGFVSQAMTGRVHLNMQNKLIWAKVLSVSVDKIDPKFEKRHPSTKAPVIKLRTTEDAALVNESYQLTWDHPLGLIPKGAVLHANPNARISAGNFVLIKLSDTTNVFVARIDEIQKTQMKVITPDEEPITLKYTNVDYYHKIEQVELP